MSIAEVGLDSERDEETQGEIKNIVDGELGCSCPEMHTNKMGESHSCLAFDNAGLIHMYIIVDDALSQCIKGSLSHCIHPNPPLPHLFLVYMALHIMEPPIHHFKLCGT
jgi:hypothetical protein